MNCIPVLLLLTSLHNSIALTADTTKQDNLIYHTIAIPLVRTNRPTTSDDSNIFTTITKTMETNEVINSNASITTKKSFVFHSSVSTTATTGTDRLCFSNAGTAPTAVEEKELFRSNGSAANPSMATSGSSQLYSGVQETKASLSSTVSTIDQCSIHHTRPESTSRKATTLCTTSMSTPTGEEKGSTSIQSATGEEESKYSSIPTTATTKPILRTNMTTSTTAEEGSPRHYGTPPTTARSRWTPFHSRTPRRMAFRRTIFHRHTSTTVNDGVFRSNISREYGELQYNDVQLICTSARDFSSLEDKMDKLMVKVKSGERLPSNIYIDNHPRDRCRAYSVIVKEVVEQIRYANTNNMPVWYVFDGLGSEWVGMADDLIKIPVCEKTLRKLHEALKPESYDLLGTILSHNVSVYENIINAFTCITAVQMALVDLLRSIDLHPGGMIGYSVGETSCAYADGALTAEEAILTAYFRGRSIVEANVRPGAMAYIGLPAEQLLRKIPVDRNISIACHNSPDSVTISGLQQDVNEFIGLLKSNKVQSREFASYGFAFHSEYIKEAGPIYSQYLQKVIKSPKHRNAHWISSSAEKSRWNTPISTYAGPDYFVNNLLSPVLFYEASMYLPKKSVILEIGAHNVLQSTLKRTLSKKAVILSLQRKVNARNLAYLMSSLGKFYVAGGLFKIPDNDEI